MTTITFKICTSVNAYRATEMEGSFGTQKQHYGLRKIAARIKSTEILLIFFGIHTANVVNLARRESVQVALAA